MNFRTMDFKDVKRCNFDFKLELYFQNCAFVLVDAEFLG